MFKDMDAEELNGLAKVYQRDKAFPLLVGSVSGNVGSGECTSGFMSVVRAIIALEEGMIPPTINYNSPNPNVPALIDRTIKVCAIIILIRLLLYLSFAPYISTTLISHYRILKNNSLKSEKTIYYKIKVF